MNCALAALLLLPFLGALASATVRRPARARVAALATLGAQGVVALGLMIGTVHGTSAALAAPWVRSLGLELAFRADLAGVAFALAALAVVTGLLASGPGRASVTTDRTVPVLVLGGLAQAFVLADNLLLLAVCALLASATVFALERSDPAHDGDGAAFDLFAATAGGLALLAGALLVADATGRASLDSLPVALAAWRTPPLAPLALGLLALGAWTRAARWPFAPLPDRPGATTGRSGALSMLCGAYLVLRLLPLVDGGWVRAALLSGLPAMALLLTGLARALRAESAR